jgi:glycosidase
MNQKLSLLIIPIIILSIGCTNKSNTENLTSKAPEWTKDAVWYQIFVERFRNGDSSNDPTKESLKGTFPHEDIDSWTSTPWTQQWYKKDKWASELSNDDFYYSAAARRYGGDLKGVMDKLDYLHELGINAIYFNPLNDAPSLHKYDAANYRHIDRHFGPSPALDAQIMQSEIPEDPSTWQWTSADSLFLKVVGECHKRNIRVIMDYSWNHTGYNFWAFQDIIKNGKESKFADWYEIEIFDDPETEENEFHYKGWFNVKELPEFKRTITSEKPLYAIGYLEGNFDSETLKQHIFNVSK